MSSFTKQLPFQKGYKICITHIFQENINRVWQCIRNISLICSIDPTLLSHVEITKGTNTWTEGSEFSSYWVGVSNFKAKCIQEQNDQHFKQISWYYSLDIQIEFTKKVSLYEITSTGTTLCVLDLDIISIDKDEYVPLNTTSDIYSNLYRNYFSKMNKFMKANPIHISNVESCIVNQNIETLWNYVTDLNKLTKLSKMTADSFKYNDDRFREGTFIKGIDYENNKTIFLRIKKVVKDCSLQTWTYSFETFGTNSKIFKQEIEINFTKVNENSCQIAYIHLFKDYIPGDVIKMFSKDKLSFLQKLKDIYNNE